MRSEIWVALVSAIGGSSIVGSIVAWWKDREKDDAEVTAIIRQLSKEAVADARSDLRAIRADMDELLVVTREMKSVTREMKSVLRELAAAIERDVLPLISDHPLTAAQLQELASKANRLS